MVNSHILIVFFPFFAAALYGLSYALNQKIFGSVSISTYMIICSIISAVAGIWLHLFSPFKIDLSSLAGKSTGILVLLAAGAATLAFILTSFAIKNISASYAAIAEISYPLFTVLFGYMIFSRKIDWSMAAGATLIIAGSFLIVSDKLNGR